LKIEISFRKKKINIKDINKIENLNVYTIDAIFNQKLEAMKYRTVARDLYDIAFILDNYFSKLTEKSMSKAEKLITAIDNILERYLDSFFKDELLGEGAFDKTEGRLKDFKNRLKFKENKISLNLLFEKNNKDNGLER